MGRAGTSACVHGKFYCRNRGYTPQLLNASMVDDGFCGEGLPTYLWSTFMTFQHHELLWYRCYLLCALHFA